MGLKNKISPNGIYYLTTTVVEWVDVFTRPVYRDIIVEALKYCQKEKGLVLYSWCLMSNHLHWIASAANYLTFNYYNLMSNHLHWIASAADGFNLSDIIRDFKKYTSKKIVSEIESNQQESRKKWMLEIFKNAIKENPKNKFWQDSNEAKELISNNFIDQKINYIHNNPIVAEIVKRPEDYIYSSASNYADEGGLLDVVVIK